MSDSTTLKQALYAIKKLQLLLQNQQPKSFQPIAIVGLSCRFPQANNKNAYWQLLKNAQNVVSRLPEQRWQLLHDTEEFSLRDNMHPYWGGYLDSIADFDAYFFGISPREALRMDPQQRILLEVAYEAIEDAGIALDTLAGSNTGVFASLYTSQYAHLQSSDITELDALFLPTGNATSIAANRLSYLFDLHGPSLVVDTACSSSLVALQLACLNLQNRLCDTALVCGVHINLLPSINKILSAAKMLSATGQCKTFDASADGYTPGEGVGVIVLKTLDQAIIDQDRIYAVITGSAINQDGKTNGLTAPNGLQQEALLKSAYTSANIDPLTISYVECHGTGTFLGDPIEVEALGEIIGKQRDVLQPCWIGSVKTNLGHLEPAAGIASIIKVALALQYAQIPPHLKFSTPNPHIAFDQYHFKIPQKLIEWPVYGTSRIAGISGFGFGGTNAHIVMREVATTEKSAILSNNTVNAELFTLSAKDPTALLLLINSWCEYLATHSSLNLAQICYNLHLRRAHHSHRLAIITHTTTELVVILSALNVLPIEQIVTTDKIFINTNGVKNIDVLMVDNNLENLAKRYINHNPIDWKLHEQSRQFPHMDMPLYPWQHKTYWSVSANSKKIGATIKTDSHPLQGKALVSPLKVLQFEFVFDKKILPEIQDTFNIAHAGYYLEMLSFALSRISEYPAFSVENLIFLSPLLVPDDTIVKVQLLLETDGNSNFLFNFYSQTQGQKNWIEHAKGKLVLSNNNQIKITDKDLHLTQANATGDAEKFYARIIAMGMPAGESVQWTHQYWLDNQEIVAKFQQPKLINSNSSFQLKVHPGIIDACIQALFPFVHANINSPYVAAKIGRLNYYGALSTSLYLQATLKAIAPNGNELLGNWCLRDVSGQIMAECENITMTKIDNKIQIDKIMQTPTHEKFDLNAKSTTESKSIISNYLITHIANIFTMPKEDIHTQQSLRDMGIDSLMALALMRIINNAFNINYSLPDILQGPTIELLAANISDALHQPATEKQLTTTINPWIAYREKQTNTKIRLFCFPYGGGSASIYRDWQQSLPSSIEVCPIQLPGREARLDESPIEDLQILVERLTENLQTEFDLPFAFFGHSFGALIAFELIRHLRKHNLPLPVHLFVSAFPDPCMPRQSLDNLLLQLKANNLNLFTLNTTTLGKFTSTELSDLVDIFSANGLVEYKDKKMTREVMQVLLPIFVGDMNVVQSYHYYQDPALDLPITVFSGKQDTWVTKEEIIGWEKHTNQTCNFYEFDSGHLFIKDFRYRKEILATITNMLELRHR